MRAVGAKLALLLVGLAHDPAVADPLRLRGDALATAQAPTGLMVLRADQRTGTWLDAEAMVWLGAGDDARADALVVAVAVRDPKDRATLRLGRFVVTSGALMPSHMDGAEVRGRLPGSVDLGVFGGLQVAPQFGPRSFDWIAGTRVGRRFGEARLGLGLLERRDANLVATRELGADAAVPVGPVDLSASAAWDLVESGLAQLDLAAGWRSRKDRLEVFARQRSPSHLLPATSLFSVLGDAPTTRFGVSEWRRVAPRLDLTGTVAILTVLGELDGEALAEARLRLDDRGASVLSLGLRRQGTPEGGFTGGRGAARVAIGPRLGVAVELELAVPDDPDGRGAIWPWGLAAITFRPAPRWELAAALEANASPTDRARVDALARLSRAWEL